MTTQPIGLLKVICKNKYLRHTYWRYITDVGTFLMIHRHTLRACIFEELLTHSKDNVSVALELLERIDKKDNFKTIPTEYIVFNKLTLCCLIDNVVSETLLSVTITNRKVIIDNIIRKIIMKGAKHKVANSQEEVATFLGLKETPSLESLLIENVK